MSKETRRVTGEVSAFISYPLIALTLVVTLGVAFSYYSSWQREILAVREQSKTTAYNKTEQAVLGQEVIEDQSCTNTNPNTYENIINNTPNEQTFRPVHNRLTRVVLKIGGMNMNGDTPLRLRLLTLAGTELTNAIISPSGISGGQVRAWNFNDYEIIQGQVYILRLEKTGGPGTPYWYSAGFDCASYGNAQQANEVYAWDFDYATYGYYVPAPGEGQVATTTTTTKAAVTATTATTTAAAASKVSVAQQQAIAKIKAAPTVAASVLGIPKNFQINRDLKEEIILSWDLNTETDVTGYAMFITEDGVEKEIIDIPGKDVDNYNIILRDHPLLELNKPYQVRLVAKTAAAISEKTEPLTITFEKEAPKAIVVKEAKKSILENTWVLGGLMALLVALIGLLVFLERKFHGLGKLFKKSESVKK